MSFHISLSGKIVLLARQETETETGNKGKQKVKQHSKTTPNTPILPKTTAKHLQTPEQRTKDFQSPKNLTQQQEPISTSTNIIKYLQENESDHSENLENEETESEQKKATENKEEMATAYIAKIPEFTGKDNDTTGDVNGWIAARMLKAIFYFLQGTAREWFKNLEEPFENWQAFKDAFLQQFTNNNTSITLRNRFRNIKQEIFETVMTYLGRFNKLLRQIQQLETNNYYSAAQILDQFIAELKDKLIKKVHPHALADLATAIKHAKNYEMAMEEANHTKLVNLAIGKTSSAAEEKINQLTKKIESYFTNQQQQHNAIKTTLDHHPTTNLKIVTIVEFQDTGNKIAGNYKETNKTGVINITLYHNNLITNPYHQLIIYRDHKFKTAIINQLHNQFNNNISNLYQFSNIRYHSLNNIKYQQEDWFNITNSHYKINFRITTTELIQITSCYLTIPKESDFQQPALSEDEVAAPRSNPFNNTISPAQIVQNANLSNIFPFEFEANESPFLLSNTAANEQKAIIAIYTEATVEEKPIRLILDSESAESIITYQLIQQLPRTVNRPAQTVIVIADGIKKTPVGEIDNFPFTIDEITIPVKVLVMDAPQYQALIGNNWLLKANANLDWETQELKISYQRQYTIVPATCSTFNKQSEKAPVFEFEEKKKMPLTETYMAFGSISNWAEETEQEIFEESR
ncbi:hypothetical protein G9A89_001675 [Geosiphon pyriformis]|nr:hypothetical protein G9A89_001675 [Geosiphon pyriformis]